MGAWYQHRRAVTLFIVIAVTLGSLSPMAVASQEVIVERSGTIDTGIGATVAWETPWQSASAAPLTDDPGVSIVRVRNDRQLAYIAQGEIADPAALIGLIQEDAGAGPGQRVTIERDVAEPLSYWLDLLRIDGEAFGSFAVSRSGAETDTLTLVLGPAPEFAEGLAAAQAAITIGGESVFDGVEAAGLQTLLQENLALLGEASPVAAGDAAAAPPPTATEPAASAEADIPYTEAGMVGDRSYRSPQYGVAIEWTDDWDLDETFGVPVIVDRKQHVDQVNLLWNEAFDAWMIIGIAEWGWDSMGQFVDYAGSVEVTIDVYGESASVAMSSASPGLGAIITLIDEGFDDPTLVYEEYRLGAEGTSLVQVMLYSVNPDLTQAAIEAAQAGITVDGQPVLVYYPAADVAQVHGASPPTGTGVAAG